jgi:hypothetical protein
MGAKRRRIESSYFETIQQPLGLSGNWPFTPEDTQLLPRIVAKRKKRLAGTDKPVPRRPQQLFDG